MLAFSKKTLGGFWAIIFVCLANGQENKNSLLLKGLENGKDHISEKNVVLWLQHFVAAPHPFASPAQKQWTMDIVQIFKAWGRPPHLQTFTGKAPRRDVPRLQQDVTGRNILFKFPGQGPCFGVLGGHFDTKLLTGLHLPSANDGGSSTALLLELARILGSYPASDMPCSIWIVLFDGEESVLDNWEMGQNLHGRRDNLYGSRHFVNSIKNQKMNPSWAMIIDMIGHKHQKISISAGAWGPLKNRILELGPKHKVNVSDAPHLMMEDDHTPFLQNQIPFVHMIDWTNREEWHTPKDNMAIISANKIKNLGDLILEVVKNPPIGTPQAGAHQAASE